MVNVAYAAMFIAAVVLAALWLAMKESREKRFDPKKDCRVHKRYGCKHIGSKICDINCQIRRAWRW
jgi:hypothetical protein